MKISCAFYREFQICDKTINAELNYTAQTFATPFNIMVASKPTIKVKIIGLIAPIHCSASHKLYSNGYQHFIHYFPFVFYCDETK